MISVGSYQVHPVELLVTLLPGLMYRFENSKTRGEFGDEHAYMSPKDGIESMSCIPAWSAFELDLVPKLRRHTYDPVSRQFPRRSRGYVSRGDHLNTLNCAV